MATLDKRPYWPSGVKLDSKVSFNSDGDATAHSVIWIVTWDSVTGVFFSPDYYAHDLYMDKTDGTFLEAASLEITSTLPLVQNYRLNDGFDYLRIGWASYRPNEIQANTIYTVTLSSAPTDSPIDNFAEDIETYGIRFPPRCIDNCLWIPISWCSIAANNTTLSLIHNLRPDGIHALGIPKGDCNRLLFLPVLFR